MSATSTARSRQPRLIALLLGSLLAVAAFAPSFLRAASDTDAATHERGAFAEALFQTRRAVALDRDVHAAAALADATRHAMRL